MATIRDFEKEMETALTTASRDLGKETAAMLTEDLISEILLRLPVKSLSRFRCVCKAWLRLIKSPNFIDMHLNRNKTDRILLYGKPPLMNDSTTLSIYDYESFHLISTFYLDSVVEICGPCNGLVCLSGGDNFALFNPSKNDYLVLPPRPFPCPKGWLYDVDYFGFGFVSNTNDYKVFARIIFAVENSKDHENGEDVVDKVEIYDLSTNSWREIEHDCPDFSVRCPSGTLFNESLHWFGKRADVDIILAFSISTEVFRNMEVPSDLIGKNRADTELGILNDSLALFSFAWHYPNGEEQFVDVWIMKEYGVTESWTKQVRIGPLSGIRHPLIFGKNKTILLECSKDQQLLSCDLDTHEIEELGIECSAWSTGAMVYQESSVSLFGVHLNEESDSSEL